MQSRMECQPAHALSKHYVSDAAKNKIFQTPASLSVDHEADMSIDKLHDRVTGSANV